MKRVPVLSLCGLAVVGLVASPAMAAAPFANKTPDVVVETGGDVSGVFNLNDYFSSTDTADLEFSAEGAASVGDDGEVTIFGSDAAGTDSASFTSGETQVESTVSYVGSALGNRPLVDDNNRIAGVDGGNAFFNALAGTASSAQPLAGLDAFLGGGGGTPGGGTPGGGSPGGGALVAAVGTFDLVTTESGLRVRDAAESLGSGDGAVTAGGVTATVNADGSYSLEAGDGFDEPVVVSLGASGASMDIVQVVAAPAVEASLGDDAWTVNSGNVSLGDTIEATVGPGETAQVQHAPVELDTEYVTFVAHYSADVASNVRLALVSIEGSGSFHFSQSGDAALSTSGMKEMAVTYRHFGGPINPQIQVDNVGDSGSATVTIHSFYVVPARPLTDYALNPNATLDVGADGSMAEGLGGWSGDPLGSGATGPELTGDANNFMTPTSAGAALLAGADGVANMGVVTPLPTGTYTAEVYAQPVAGEGSFFLVVTDGAANTVASVVPSAAMADGWNKVTVSSTAAESAGAFFVLQSAGADVNVDDAKIRIIDEEPFLFDARLAGM